MLTTMFFDAAPQFSAHWLKQNSEVLRTVRNPGEVEIYAPFLAALPDLWSHSPAYRRPLLEVASRLDVDLARVLMDRADAGPVDVIIPSEILRLNLASIVHFELRGATKPLELAPLLRAFADNVAQFVVPDVDAGYDLTHIVFWATSYGTFPGFIRDSCPRIVDSLLHVGTVAALDGDIDLLAEVGVALHFAGAGADLPLEWVARVRAARLRSDLDYHTYLTATWLIEIVDGCCFDDHPKRFAEAKYCDDSVLLEFFETRDRGLLGQVHHGDDFMSDVERVFGPVGVSM